MKSILLTKKIKVSYFVTYNIESEHYSTYTTVPAPDFLQRAIKIYLSHRCRPQMISRNKGSVYIRSQRHNLTTLS